MQLTDAQKAWIASSIQTFLSTFLLVVGSTIQNGIEWSAAFWGALALTALRAGIKAVFQKTSIPILGGIRKNA